MFCMPTALHCLKCCMRLLTQRAPAVMVCGSSCVQQGFSCESEASSCCALTCVKWKHFHAVPSPAPWEVGLTGSCPDRHPTLPPHDHDHVWWQRLLSAPHQAGCALLWHCRSRDVFCCCAVLAAPALSSGGFVTAQCWSWHSRLAGAAVVSFMPAGYFLAVCCASC
jgi:hypothetical protein